MVTRACPQTEARPLARRAVGRIAAPLKLALDEGSSISALWLAQRLVSAGHREMRLVAHVRCVARCRRIRRRAGSSCVGSGVRRDDWIAADSLAELYAQRRPRGGLPLGRAGAAALLRQTLGASPRGGHAGPLPHRVPKARRHELGPRWSSGRSSSCACSWVTRRSWSRRPSHGRSASGSPSTPTVAAAFLRAETDARASRARRCSRVGHPGCPLQAPASARGHALRPGSRASAGVPSARPRASPPSAAAFARPRQQERRRRRPG